MKEKILTSEEINELYSKGFPPDFVKDSVYEQIEKEFDEKFPAMDNYLDGGVKNDIKSFLKQSFIKYLQGEVEYLKKQQCTCSNGYVPIQVSEDGDVDWTGCEYCVQNGQYTEKTINISDQITHLQAQVKELEA